MIIKVCGLRELSHALRAAEEGADLLGFVFADSTRRISPEKAGTIIRHLPSTVRTVGVFVNEEIKTVNEIADYCGLDMVQLHGEESPEYCRQVNRPVIKAFRVKNRDVLPKLGNFGDAAQALLLDTYVGGTAGGTGLTFDWTIAREAAQYGNIILAGGLTPANVGRAIAAAQPYGVDASSGLETDGIKDPAKIAEFVRRARMSWLSRR